MAISRLLLAPLVVALAACSSATTPTATTPSAADSQALKVCVSDNSLPWSSKDAANPGVEVDYGKSVAAALQREYEPVWVTSFDQAIPALRSGKCNAVINGLYITSERSKLVSFSNPTWGSRFEVVMRTGESAASLADLKGRCVATLAGSVSVDDLRAAGLTPRTFDSNDKVLRSVKSGECDAAVVESPTAGWSLEQAEFAGLSVVPALTGTDTYFVGVAVNQEDAALLAQVNEAVAKIRSSGELERILARYNVPAYLP